MEEPATVRVQRDATLVALERDDLDLLSVAELGERVQRLEAEFELTVRELVAIGGGRRLLDSEPVLQASIDRRNPAVAPLSFIQVELLARIHAAQRVGEEPSEALRRVSQLTINGIASGLRNTG